MKGNLMDSIVSLASIAKRYSISIHIENNDKGPLIRLEFNCSLDRILCETMYLYDIIDQDFDDICRRWVHELTGTVQNQ